MSSQESSTIINLVIGADSVFDEEVLLLNAVWVMYSTIVVELAWRRLTTLALTPEDITSCKEGGWPESKG